MNAPAREVAMGHNEMAARLGILASDAQRGLERVAEGSAAAIEGWLIYGAALNEGRAMFHPEDDKGFGQWVADLHRQLVGVDANDHERAAAMWAADFPEQFAEARAAGGARTVRGIHAKWKEAQAERAAAQEAEAKLKEADAKRREADEARRKADAARKEAEARALAEAEARRRAQQAAAEEDRREAMARAEEEAQARRTALAEAETAEEEADAADDEAEAAEEQAADIVDNSKKVRGTQGTGNDEWYTPQDLIDRARNVLGGFDLDPASNDMAQEKVRAGAYFTAETNGLAHEWHGKVWLNPPYSQPLIGQFIDKLVEEWGAGRCTGAVMLTHNYTDTRWFQTAARAASAICFTRGRVKFYSPSGAIAAPTQGQAFFYFGDDVAGFAREFGEVGFVVVVQHG